MNELSLFTGAGGGLLGSAILGWRTVCAVEIDPYCREVLLKRQNDGVLPLFPIWDDIRSFDGKPWRGKVDILTGGFPCQPFSVAGKRKGKDDSRNMWPETIRVIREVRPRLCFLENVPGLITSGYFGRILGDLAESGYDAKWCVLGASDIGANHRRKRLWILAYTNKKSGYGRKDEKRAERRNQPTRSDSAPSDKDVAYSRSDTKGGAHRGTVRGSLGKRPSQQQGCEVGADTTDSGSRLPNTVRVLPRHGDDGNGEKIGARPNQKIRSEKWWLSEPNVGRVAHGVAFRVDRLKAIGNGQVPLCMAYAYERLAEGVTR